jgi:hypothetical protein
MSSLMGIGGIELKHLRTAASKRAHFVGGITSGSSWESRTELTSEDRSARAQSSKSAQLAPRSAYESRVEQGNRMLKKE